MLYLTRRERFCAAHKLWIEDWSEEKTIKRLVNAQIQIGMVTIMNYLLPLKEFQIQLLVLLLI